MLHNDWSSNPHGSGRKLTYRDFLRIPDDGRRHELIDGVHTVTPSPLSPHQIVLGNLYFLIRSHLESSPTGKVYLSPLDVVFSMFDIVEPDLFYVSNARAKIVTRRNVRGAPDLVVEIRSETTAARDEGVKLALYDRCGVDEYWVMDPEEQTVRVYRRRGSRLAVTGEIASASGGVLASPLLPGLSIDLARVFAE